MATVRQYATNLWPRAVAVAMKHGWSPQNASKKDRALLKTVVLMFAVILRVLWDKGVASDAELDQYFSVAADDIYPDEPIEPPG